MSDVVVDVPQSRGGVRVEVSKRRDIVEGAVGVHDTINMTASANYHYQCPTRNHLMVVCGMPYRYAHFRQHGFYTGEIHRGTRLPHGLGKWRSPDASTYMEGEWFDGHLYMKIKPQQGEHNNNKMIGQPERQRHRASESDLSLSALLEPIMEHSRCSDDDDDKTIKPRKPKRRARRVTAVESSNIDRKQLSKSWTAGCDYDPPVPTKSNKRPSIVHTDPIYCVPINDNVKTTTQKKSRFQEIKEPEDNDPIIEEEKNLSFCREIVSPFQEVKDPPANLFIPPADLSFCQSCV